MVESAESLIRPRWSVIVTRVPWFELAEILMRLGWSAVQKFRGFWV